MLGTKSLKFRYAVDWILLCQSKDLQKIEAVLFDDLSTLNSYFKHWYLRWKHHDYHITLPSWQTTSPTGLEA